MLAPSIFVLVQYTQSPPAVYTVIMLGRLKLHFLRERDQQFEVGQYAQTIGCNDTLLQASKTIDEQIRLPSYHKRSTRGMVFRHFPALEFLQPPSIESRSHLPDKSPIVRFYILDHSRRSCPIIKLKTMKIGYDHLQRCLDSVYRK